uniref:Ketopantoate reductase C-terminal domain-containing protein n=1 Tax=Rhizochromulina marina TaxID=1034831 RepID=A0A7S2WVG3_9STRA
MASGRRKPDVAVVYSSLAPKSRGSHDLAFYLGGLLFLGGYSTVHMVEFQTSSAAKSQDEPSLVGVKVLPFFESTPQSIQECGDFHPRAKMEVLSRCQVILVCVHGPETKDCAQALRKLIPDHGGRGLFAFQIGCRHYSHLRDAFNESGNWTFEGAVGFRVVWDESGTCLGPLKHGSIVVERLSRDKADMGTKYTNLLETMGIPMLFQKTVTALSWGTMVHDLHLYAAAALGVKVDALFALRDRRMIYALMMRECLSALSTAAGQGGWSPSNQASCAVSLEWIEQLLCLPDALFWPFKRLFYRPALPKPPSPVLVDRLDGKCGDVAWVLKDLVEVGNKYGAPMPVCTRVLHLLSKNVAPEDAVATTLSLKDVRGANSSLSDSTRRLIWSILRLCAVVSALICLWMLLDTLPRREITLGDSEPPTHEEL